MIKIEEILKNDVARSFVESIPNWAKNSLPQLMQLIIPGKHLA